MKKRHNVRDQARTLEPFTLLLEILRRGQGIDHDEYLAYAAELREQENRPLYSEN
ncbi:MAG: hypothetical protein GYB64_05355 [Chloroflexi bacterium]|nr:hypothetical protein [Chloroflexota bacterium]